MSNLHVYRNRTKGCWSLRKSGKVIGHTDKVYLVNAELRVQPGGWERWLRTGDRNVHAYIAGDLYRGEDPGPIEGRPVNCRRAFYNLNMGEFQLSATGERITESEFVHLDTHGGLWVKDNA